MNTHFKSALNKVEAENELVEKTETYLRSALENPHEEKIISFEKRSVIQMKKILVASIASVFVIGAFVGGYSYFKTPVAYISLDINPSVELGVNAFNSVVSVEGVNEDGQAILEGQDIINTDVTDALDQLIDSATEKDYINDDGTSVISITAQSNDENKAADLTDISEQAVNETMVKKEVTATVYKNCSDLSLRTEAKGLGISPGKLKLIKSLQALDPTITVDQLKDSKVSEIMLKANELITALDTQNAESELSESQIKAIEALKNVAKKADDSVKNAANAEFQAAKEQAKTTFEDAKKQAETITNDAKTKADELRKQAQDLQKSTKGMTGTEKAAVLAQAEELRKQAEALIVDAGAQAAELKQTAAQKKAETMEAAQKLKDTAKQDNEEEATDENDGSDIDQEQPIVQDDNKVQDQNQQQSKIKDGNIVSDKDQTETIIKENKEDSGKNQVEVKIKESKDDSTKTNKNQK